MAKQPSIATPLKRARGLGSAHTGVHHFWVLRVSALALVPLSIWFVVALLKNLIGADAAGVGAWLHGPITALLMAAMIVAMFLHAKLGMQEVFEDYIQCKAKKITALLLLNTLTYGLGGAALLAIAHLHFGV